MFKLIGKKKIAILRSNILLVWTFDIGPVKKKIKRKIVIIFLSINLNICFGCSKEPSFWDHSIEYPQHMFGLRNKKNNFKSHTLIWGLVFSCIWP